MKRLKQASNKLYGKTNPKQDRKVNKLAWWQNMEGQNTFVKGQMDFYVETKAKNRDDCPS